MESDNHRLRRGMTQEALAEYCSKNITICFLTVSKLYIYLLLLSVYLLVLLCNIMILFNYIQRAYKYEKGQHANTCCPNKPVIKTVTCILLRRLK